MEHQITFSDLIRHRSAYSEDREAVYDYDHQVRYTYRDMAQRANKLAYFMRHVLHLQKGDRIGFCAYNSMAFLDAFYASCQTGIIITTYNYMLHPKEIQAQIANEQPRVLFYSKQFAPLVSTLKAAGGPEHTIAINGPAAEGESCCYGDIMAAEDHACEPEDVDMEDIQMLIHTGGTTGAPKAAKISYRSLFYNQICEILTFGLNAADSIFICMPWFHTGGWNLFTLPLLMLGGRLIIAERFDPEQYLEVVRRERTTCMMAVETMYKALAASPSFADTDLSCIRMAYNGGSPIARETLEKYWDRGVKLANAYGMTEAGPNDLAPPAAQMSIEDIKARWNAAGMPMYFNQVRVVDDRDRDVAPGEKGELIWKGALTFSGYWNNEKATAEVMTADGWVRSGDIAYRDPEGYYYLCGRKKNMFISGGENIFPVEIETVLQEHPAIHDCHVFGVPDERWGEVGKALVVLRPDTALSEEALRTYLKGHITFLKTPKYIVFTKAIPRNVMGKVDARKVQELYG